MTVKDILTITSGNTKFCIQGTTESDEIVQLAHGKVNDIKFPLVPYLATFEATKKWTSTIRNWAQVYGELSIMYEERLPE